MNRDRRSHHIALVFALAAAMLALAGAGSAAPAAPTAAKPPKESVPGELLVGFRADVSSAEQRKVLAKVGAVEKRRFNRIHGALARLQPDAVAHAIDELRSDPRVRYAEPNFVVHADAAPNDPFYSRLWGLNNTGQPVNGFPGTPDADIDAEEAWSVTTGSANVTVAVIDTGVDYSHPDLSSAIWINPGEDCAGCRTDGVDNDGNGYVDDWRGWDFANHDNAPADDHGHGTHVAGTIGAVGDNGIGVTGVNWNVRVMPLKFLSSTGTGTTADAISAVLYAAAKGADVLNNSWAGDEYSQALGDAIADADAHGSLFVAAAGNDGRDNDATPTYPASYELPNVVSVAATDDTDDLAFFSNAGRRSVDLGAPGVNIYSTWPGASYRDLSGTSMAAPHVAGAAALVKSAFPTATDMGIKAFLLDSVDATASLAGLTTTGGRLNVASAVGCNESPNVWLETPAPSFDVAVGTSVPVTAIAGRCGNAGGIAVSASANGTPITLAARSDGLYTGSYTPTAAGPVTVAGTGSAAGRTETRTVSGVASQTAVLTPGGSSVTVTTSSAGENARVKFDGQAGQRVSLKLSAVTISGSYVSILKPDGNPLGSNTYVGSAGAFVDTRTLPVAGSYTILVDPLGSATGSMTLSLYDVPPDAAGAIVPSGAALTVTASTPGQNPRVSFDGQAGQRVSLKLSAVTISGSYVSILKPDGNPLGSNTYVGSAGAFVDTRTLPVAGSYTILVDPLGSATGSMTLSLYDVPPDAAGAIVPSGAALTVTAGTPGQNPRVSFDGQAGQRVSLKLSAVTISGSYVSILKPDGNPLGSNTYVGSAGAFVDTRTLPVAGSYTILVDPQAAATGNATLTLYDVPADVAGSLTIGGSPMSVTLVTPGQNARISFDGRAGQRISLKLSGVTISTSYVSILNPNGSALVSPGFVTTFGRTIISDLTADGAYTIVLDPVASATGNATLTLTQGS